MVRTRFLSVRYSNVFAVKSNVELKTLSFLGFIGKMFKSTDLPYLITYFQMFYNDQPGLYSNAFSLKFLIKLCFQLIGY